MQSKTYQVIVHGRFGPLDDVQRTRLLAEAPAHDLFQARFTEDGTLTYEPPLLAFTFRCLVPADESDKEAAVLAKAEALATAAVSELGAEPSNLRSVATDLATVKVRPRTVQRGR